MGERAVPDVDRTPERARSGATRICEARCHREHTKRGGHHRRLRGTAAQTELAHSSRASSAPRSRHAIVNLDGAPVIGMHAAASVGGTAAMSTELSSIAPVPMCSSPQFDAAKYRQHLEGFDLTEEQQTELLAILWRILATFVDLGFGVDSVQLLPALAQASAEDEVDQLEEGRSTEG
jgi:hypothetical protein